MFYNGSLFVIFLLFMCKLRKCAKLSGLWSAGFVVEKVRSGEISLTYEFAVDIFQKRHL